MVVDFRMREGHGVKLRGGRKVLKRREGKKDEESEEVVLSREGRRK